MKLKQIFQILMPFCLALVAGSALFWTSRAVQDSQDHLELLKNNITFEREAIRVLQAEWSYLNTPERLEDLANRHLGMGMPAASSMKDGFDSLPEFRVPVVPAHKPKIYQDAVYSPEAFQSEDAAANQSPSLIRDGGTASKRPENKPIKPAIQNGQSFFDLLGDLTGEGGERD